MQPRPDLGRSEGVFGASWAVLAHLRDVLGGLENVLDMSWDSLGSVLEPYWMRLGTSWHRLRKVLGQSWVILTPLGPCLGNGKLEVDTTWPCGLMDKALVFGTKDCRFESCQGHFHGVHADSERIQTAAGGQSTMNS